MERLLHIYMAQKLTNYSGKIIFTNDTMPLGNAKCKEKNKTNKLTKYMKKLLVIAYGQEKF